MTPALVLSKNIFYRNRESEHISNLEDCVRIIIIWSECRDSNSRPLEPHSSAIPNFATPGYFVALSSALEYSSIPCRKKQVLFCTCFNCCCKLKRGIRTRALKKYALLRIFLAADRSILQSTKFEFMAILLCKMQEFESLHHHQT